DDESNHESDFDEPEDQVVCVSDEMARLQDDALFNLLLPYSVLHSGPEARTQQMLQQREATVQAIQNVVFIGPSGNGKSAFLNDNVENFLISDGEYAQYVSRDIAEFGECPLDEVQDPSRRHPLALLPRIPPVSTATVGDKVECFLANDNTWYTGEIMKRREDGCVKIPEVADEDWLRLSEFQTITGEPGEIVARRTFDLRHKSTDSPLPSPAPRNSFLLPEGEAGHASQHDNILEWGCRIRAHVYFRHRAEVVEALENLKDERAKSRRQDGDEVRPLPHASVRGRLPGREVAVASGHIEVQ
ncbi:hypothetical protein CYMTET_35967, partial [Cymbomonas tetramitiformis]